MAKASHEIKNPSISIYELCNEIEKSLINSSLSNIGLQGNIQVIKNLSCFITNLVNDFDLIVKTHCGRKVSLQLISIDLTEEINFLASFSHIMLNKNNSNNSVEFVLVNEITNNIKIQTDLLKFRQILINLLSNAIKFTHNGYIIMTVKINKTHVSISIEDTGIGIEDKIRNCLFKSPIQSKKENNNIYGNGYGLLLSKDLSLLLGFELLYDYKKQEGSCFTLNIPLNYISVNSIKSRKNEESYFCNDNTNETKKLSLPFKLDFDNFKLNSFKSTSKIERKSTTSCHLFNSSYFKRTSLSNRTKEINQEVLNFTIIVVDDEKLIRSSTIRCIDNYLKSQESPISIVIYEAEDGFECLFLTYFLQVSNINIDAIIMDETMKYMSGSICSEILQKCITTANLKSTKICILSAYSKDLLYSKFNLISSVKLILSKPLSKENCKDIFKMLKNK